MFLYCSWGADISKLCIESIGYLADCIAKSPEFLNTNTNMAMKHFLKVIYDLSEIIFFYHFYYTLYKCLLQIIFDLVFIDSSFDMELFDYASHTLFALICCQSVCTLFSSHSPMFKDKAL